MSQKGLFIWASTATLVAVGALGYSLGKHASNSSENQYGAVSPTELPVTTEPGAAVEPVPEYVIPESFANVPSQWRSPNTDDLAGYAVLFDPTTRQAIVQSCHHNGYRLDDSGQPLELLNDFCTSVLHGELSSLTDEEAVVKTGNGETVTLKLEPDMTGDPVSLKIEFDGHDMDLIPGSRNDLLQAMEQEPVVKERKRRYFTAANARERGTPNDNGSAE